MTQSPNVPRHFSADFRRVLIALSLINVFVLLLIAVALFSSYRTHRQMAQVAASNISRVLVENLGRFMDKVDLCLISATIEAQNFEAGDPDDQATMTQFLNGLSEQVRENLRLTAVDEQGRVWAKTADVDPNLEKLDESEAFRFFVEHPDASLNISVPTARSDSDIDTLDVARKLVDGKGRFVGMVRASIRLEHIGALFTPIDLGAHGVVTVTDRYARALARAPFAGLPGSYLIGKILPNMARLLEQGEVSASYRVASVVDGVTRTYFFRPVSDRPLYVLVGIADQDMLSTWHREITVMCALYFLFLVISISAAILLFRNGRAREAAIVELQRKEESLALFRQAIERSNDAILIIDNQTAQLADFNQAACEQLGYESAELRQLTVMDVDPALPSLDHWRSMVADIQGLETGVTIQRVHRRKNGTTFPVEIGWRRLSVRGRDLSISVERDATEKERIEREMLANTAELERMNAALRESNADLERFASLASHDLQTPLRTIVSFGQLLNRRSGASLDDEGREFLTFIVDGAKRMSNLIKDLLQYSRTISQQPVLKAVSASMAAGAAAANLSGPVVETGAKIEIGLLPDVLAEYALLVSLFQNLMENAIKYRDPERAPAISVTAEPAESGWWRLSVADNGIGIDPAYHRKVFDIFQRLDPSGTIEGTGIGLSVCQRIVGHFGGEIWIESEPGQGTMFHFTLRSAES